MSYPEQNGTANSGPSISVPRPRYVPPVNHVLWSILIILLVLVGLIIGLIAEVRHDLRTHHVQFYATNATLSTFNFTTNNNHLNFNLVVRLCAFNPDPRISIYGDVIVVDAIYQGQRLKTIQAELVYHEQKNTTSSSRCSDPVSVFKGQKIVVLATYDKSEFDKQSNQGVYEIQLKFHLWAGVKYVFFKIGSWKATVQCDLNVPLAGKSSATFHETKCRYYF